MQGYSCLSNGCKIVSGFLAKPRRVRFQGIISVVALIVKATSIPCKARLGYDTLETYKILWDLIRGPFHLILHGRDMADDQLNEQESKEFYTMADTFIDVANGHCEKKETNHVGSSMLFAAARFSSFVVASQSPDKDAYEAEIETATEFFSKEFKRMLTQNLEDYKTAFKAQEDEPRYEHLKKKD